MLGLVNLTITKRCQGNLMLRYIGCAESVALKIRRYNHPAVSNIERVMKHISSKCHNLKVLKFDEEQGVILLKHPGFSFGHFDATGHVPAWEALQMLSSGHFFLKSHKLQQTGKTFRDYNSILEGATQQIISMEALFGQQMYDDKVPKIPLYVSLDLPYTGTTSYLFKTTVYSDVIMNNKLFHCATRIVNVDKTTRRSIPLRVSKTYPKADSRPHILESSFRPNAAMVYETTIGFSDIGPEGRSHIFSFSKYALDAVYHEVISGTLEGFPNILKNGVRCIRQLHKMEGVIGDRLQIYVWQNCKNSKIYHCDITTRNTFMCQCTIEFF